jgi:hypothetical protein
MQTIADAPAAVVQFTIADPPRTRDQCSTLCALARKVADLVEQTTGAGHNRQNSPRGLLLTYTPASCKTTLSLGILERTFISSHPEI